MFLMKLAHSHLRMIIILNIIIITNWRCRNCEEFTSLLSYKWFQLTAFSDSLKESLHPYSFVKSSTDRLTSSKELESNLLGNELQTYLGLLMRPFFNFVLFCFTVKRVCPFIEDYLYPTHYWESQNGFEVSKCCYFWKCIYFTWDKIYFICN